MSVNWGTADNDAVLEQDVACGNPKIPEEPCLLKIPGVFTLLFRVDAGKLKFPDSTE
jgi:hypothetical protein